MSQGSLTTRRLVEEYLPLSKINENSENEAGFIRAPKINNLHPYLARRPTSTARALTLASVLPSLASREEFERALGLDKISSVPFRLLYLVNPDKAYVKELVKKYTGRGPENIVVVDPMAGGGAIPLEALRLGFRTVAMDYNPVAYIILKATLEYPAKYGDRLYEDVKKEAEALIEYTRKELSQYYAEDAYNYIVARGYRCPYCGGLIPIVHSNRLYKGKPNKRKPIYVRFDFNKQEKSFTMEITNGKEEFERLRCPYCGTPLHKEVVLRDWVKRHKELLRVALSGDVEKAKEKIQELLETHMILIKETPEGFKPADEKDRQALVKAYLDLTAQIKELREYLPDVQIPKENEVFTPIREMGIEYWYELFNPRQLLILLKLMKYVKERMKTLVEEHGEYGFAVSLYLALGISKFVNFNNIATTWHDSKAVIRDLISHYSKSRSVDLGLEYCEMPPITKDPGKSLGWVFEPHVTSIGRTAGGILPVLRLLTQWLGGLGDKIYVLSGDARKLSSILKEIGIDAVDVVNVDPPYLAQHFYSDLMEFFWQVLRIMLQTPIEHGYLFNRDPSKGRVELYIEGWSPLLPVLPREEEIIARKGKDKIRDLSNLKVERLKEADKIMKYTGEWYVFRMWEFFSETYKVLRDDGVLVVWFTHSDPAAWEAIVSSLYAAGFTLSKAWPIWTEMETRRVALLTSAFFTSLALVLRKGDMAERVITGPKEVKDILRDENVKEAIKRGVHDALISARMSGTSGPELFIMGLAGGIAGATRIWNPIIEEVREEELSKQKSSTEYIEDEARRSEIELGKLKKAVNFFDTVLYPAATYLSLEALLEDYMEEVAKLDDRMKRDVLNVDNNSKAYLLLWIATRYAGKRELAYDFVEKVLQTLNVNRQFLTNNYGLVKQEKSESSKKSKSSTYRVLFGGEVYDAVKGRLEMLTATVVGRAIQVLRLIGEQPKDDVTRVARALSSKIPISRSDIAMALFLLRTASEDELELAKLSRISKDFAENVLIKLYQGV
jgi:adenine-specific DNA methylase